MSDSIQPAPAADLTSTPTAPALDPGITAARAQWVSYGFDPATFDRANGVPAPTPAPAASNEVAPPPLEISPSLRPADAAQMQAGLLKAGVPLARIQEALKADGIPVTEDTRSDDERVYDQAHGFGQPPAPIDPIYWPSLQTTPNHAAAVVLQSEAQALCHDLMFDPGIGKSWIEQLVQDQKSYAAMSPDAQHRFDVQQRAILLGRAGDEATLVKQETELIAFLKTRSVPSSLRDALLRPGISAWSWATAFNQSARVGLWEAGKPKKETA
jgi:hypothetical protein